MKICKKKNFNKLYLYLAGALTVTAICCLYLILTYTPSTYQPAQQLDNNNQPSKYLTHQLAPQFYNGLQKQKPFDLVLIQQGVNETIANLQYPVVSDGLALSKPTVSFSPEGLRFMCTAQAEAAEFVVTIDLNPRINQQGLLYLNLKKMKIGAMPVTIFTKSLIRKICKDMVGSKDYGPGDIGEKLAIALLKDQPIDPVIDIDDKKVRIREIAFSHEKLTFSFIPATGS